MRRVIALTICVCLAVSQFALSHQTAGAQQAKTTARLLHTIPDSYSFWWSPDNKSLAVLSKNVLLYDVETGRVKAELKYERIPSAKGVAFTPDGGKLIIHTDRVRLYDSRDGKLLREFADDTTPINYYERIFTGSESSSYSSETGQTETTWNPPSAEEETQELPTRYISDRTISPDGKSLLVRAKKGKAQLYDLGTGELKFTFEPLVAQGDRGDRAGDALGEFSPDGSLIVTAHRNRTARVWNAATGALVADLATPTGSILGVRFSDDGKFIATTTFEEGLVRIWEAATGKLRQTIGTKKERHYFAVWNPQHNSFVTKTTKWEVNIWNAETGALVAKLNDKAIKEKFDQNQTFVYSPDGKLLLTQARHTNSFFAVLGLKKRLALIAHLWDARTGTLIASLRDNKTRDAYEYQFDKYFWSPASDSLITAGISVKMWNSRGEFMQELDGNAMAGASLSPDGRLLATTGDKLVTTRSMLIEVAKIMIGKLPKLPSRKMQVWQLADN